MKNTESEASRTMLHEPVKAYIRAGWFWRLFFIKQWPLHIYPLRTCSMVKIGGVMARMRPLEVASKNQSAILASMLNIRDNSKSVSQCIAIALINRRSLNCWLSPIVAWWLSGKLTNTDMAGLMFNVVGKTNAKDFQITIEFLIGSSATKPKNQETSPTGTGETIAPGE